MAKTATVGMSEKVKIEFFDNIDQKPSETLKTDENLSLKCPEVNNNKNNTFKRGEFYPIIFGKLPIIS